MKQFKSLVFATLLFVGAVSFSGAQSKIAHINTQELIEAMPEMKTAEAEIQKLGKTYEAEIQASLTELQNKAKQYQAEAEAQTQEENEKRAVEIDGMRQSIAQYQQQAQQDIEKKKFELLKPITDKAKAAIQKVARAQGFQYVIDSTEGGGVILADGKDLLADVKKELGF
ncbi:OmpH family outer membrane protein [Winogradskyella aurantiaca]|uniref:OmpH family outer membrane protein n=1 Tax=Winogradskyella aurantiaca TaxID=2219558 RepID=UPI000E1CF2AF|nr:OmpH family outer membrane protein [Winogradskyella aurantiaca]